MTNPWATAHATGQKVQGSGHALPPELVLKPSEPLPYESLEVLINADNVWANTQVRGAFTAHAWRAHGTCMACAWRVHGACMARA